MSPRLLAVCSTLLFGWVLSAMAGGSSAGGGTQLAPTDNAAVSTYKVTDTSVGASARDSAGASGLSSSGSSSSSASSTGASSTDASSSNGAASSNGGAPSVFGTTPRGTRDANDSATAIAREKVIDTGDKAVETDKVAKAKSSDKTFAPGLLDKVSDISAVSAQKEAGSGSKTNESKSAESQDKSDSHK